MSKERKIFCVESFISNEETPVTTIDNLDVTVTNIKDGVVIGNVILPDTSPTPFLPLQWDLMGNVIHEGEAQPESTLDLVFKELPREDYNEVGKEMFNAISDIKKDIEEGVQKRKFVARNIIHVVSGFINNHTIECRDKWKVGLGIGDCDSWRVVEEPEWNWRQYEYRIKSHPYTKVELVEILKSGRTWVENKTSGDVISIDSVRLNDVHLVDCGWISFSKLLEEYLWLDGSTCGVEE